MPRALEMLGWSAKVVGGSGAPAEGSSDYENCRWCKAEGAILVTHDLGKGNREILTSLDEFQVGAILILTSMRKKPPVVLARALLCAESNIDAIIASRRSLRHQLRPTGKLVSPTKPRKR